MICIKADFLGLALATFLVPICGFCDTQTEPDLVAVQQKKEEMRKRPNLTPEQKAQMKEIFRKHEFGELQKDVFQAKRDYAKACLSGSGIEQAKERILIAYGALLDAEKTIRQELKAAGLPAGMPFEPKPRPKHGHGPDHPKPNQPE